MLKTKNYIIGIDLGGTYIKGGIIDFNTNIIVSDIVDTQANLGNKVIIQNISKLIHNLFLKSKISIKDIIGIGIGIPGVVDENRGIIICSYNLNFYHYNIVDELKQIFNVDIKISNDANVATLAEFKFGAGKDCDNFILLMLGTGVGGGAYINGQLLKGNQYAGGEFGHIVIDINGKKCSCGRNGCLECYASANALIKQTQMAMQKNNESKMWQMGDLSRVTAETPFMYMNEDKIAYDVIDKYIDYLVCGIANLVNIFRPEKIILGGGVIVSQRENIIKPLQKKLDKQIFAFKDTPKVTVEIAELGNLVGVLGTSLLFRP